MPEKVIGRWPDSESKTIEALFFDYHEPADIEPFNEEEAREKRRRQFIIIMYLLSLAGKTRRLKRFA